MADIAVETTAWSAIYDANALGGPYYSSVDIGAVVYIDGTPTFRSVAARKTTDGGATWGSAIALTGAQDNSAFSSWFEPATPGLTDDKIHVAYINATPDAGSEVLYHAKFDISAGTWSTPVAIKSDLTISGTTRNNFTNTTLARSGYVFVTQHTNTTGTMHYSADGGATWNSRTTPFEGSNLDEVVMFPANTADDNDIGMMYRDVSTTDMTVKMHDFSLNTNTETAVQNISDNLENTTGYNRGAVRHSDGAFIFAFLDADHSATNDGYCFEIQPNSISSPGVTALTAPWANHDYTATFVTINQQNDDIYLGLIDNISWWVTSNIVYLLSTDDGSTWGSEQAYSEAAADDNRTISGPMSIGDAGGQVQFSWFNDDINDVFVNVVNTIEIAAVAGVTATPPTATLTLTLLTPTVSTPVVVTPTTATLTLSTLIPTINVGISVTPTTASLVLTPFAPTVTGVSPITVTPTTAALVLATFIPTVTGVADVLVTPPTASLILTRFPPTVTVPAIVINFKVDTVTMTNQPTKIEDIPVDAYTNRMLNGGFSATQRLKGRQIKVTWGVAVSPTAVLAELRTKRNSLVSHTIGWVDPSGTTQGPISILWLADPNYVILPSKLYRFLSITFTERSG